MSLLGDDRPDLVEILLAGCRPNERVLLSADGGACKGEPGESWWHVFHSDYSTLHAAGFSPSGRTLAVATSSDLTLWAREGNWGEYR